MRHSDYIYPENWLGSFYELAIEYHPVGDDRRLLAGIRAAWASPYLSGSRPAPYGPEQPEPESDSLEPDGLNSRYGVLRVTERISVGCMTLTIRETLSGREGSDWLDICIPTGMLRLAFPVRYPLLREENPWLTGVDTVLLGVADAVYRSSAFDLAIIGEEASGVLKASEVTREHLTRGGLLVPPHLSRLLRPHADAITLPSGVLWFPPQDDDQGQDDRHPHQRGCGRQGRQRRSTGRRWPSAEIGASVMVETECMPQRCVSEPLTL